MSKKKRHGSAKGATPSAEPRSSIPGRGETPVANAATRRSLPAATVLVYTCVFLSGGAALVYEVVWARKLAQFLGITAMAHTAVLTAFMAGLALGSQVIGAKTDGIARPLRAYALLELGIGLYAFATLLLFEGAESLHAAVAGWFGVSGFGANAFRFVLAFALLLVPTFLMGGTLPLLVRGFSGNGMPLAQLTSRLYGLNTLGATAGAFLGGYVLLPELGMSGTMTVSAGLALIAAAGVYAMGSRLEGIPSKMEAPNGDPREAVASPGAARWILVGFALSGFAAMVYQLSWIRALTLVIGGSVYAFSTTLTTFLAGIALGSFAVSRFARSGHLRNPLGVAGWLQAGIAFSSIAGLWLIGKLPDLFLKGYQSGIGEHFSLYLGFVFLLCFGVMFVPTLLLGAVFPLVATAWAKETACVGRGIGTAYAANSVGTILGSLAGGLFLLPWLGIHGSTFLAAAASVAAGGFFWLRLDRSQGRRNLAAFGAIVAGITLTSVLIPRWDRAVMTSGVFYHTKWFTEQDDWHETVRAGNLIYYQEGVDAVVSVTESEGHRILQINGKPDGSDGEDLSTQTLLVQIPMLLHPQPRKVAVIGLGTGTSSAGAAAHRDLERLDVVEISPEVIEASNHFRAINRNVLDDPRTVLHVADARNHLHATKQTYDVIVSEPSNPWISGVANLFTREFFELAKSRLAEGGILSQWIHCYNMAPEDLRGIIRTYQGVFDHVTLWIPARGDLILIGSETPHALDFGRVNAALGEPAVHSMLGAVGRAGFDPIASAFFLGNEELKTYAGAAPLNTDDRPRLEFNAPRYLYAMTTDRNLEDLMHFLGGRAVMPPVTGLARVEEGILSIPPIGLLIRPSGSFIEKVNLAFVVNRRLEANGSLGVGTQYLLQWSEGLDLVSLAVSGSDHASSAEERREILKASLPGGILEQGEADLPAGPRASWVAGTGAEPGSTTVGLAWSSATEGGRFRDYLCLRQRSGLAEANGATGEAAARFANQFMRWEDGARSRIGN